VVAGGFAAVVFAAGTVAPLASVEPLASVDPKPKKSKNPPPRIFLFSAANVSAPSSCYAVHA